MRRHSLGITYLPIWLTRLAADDAVIARFTSNPVVFSSWYVLNSEVLNWPQEVVAIQDTERARKLSFERTVSLLSKVNYSVSDGMDVEYARGILEGYAVHSWMVENGAEFKAMLKDACERFVDFEKVLGELGRRAPGKLPELVTTLGLTALEEQVLLLSAACSLSPEISTLFEQLSRARRSNPSVLWTTMFNCSEEELAAVLAPKSNLRICRLLQSNGNSHQLPSLSPFWVQLLLSGSETLLDSLVEPLTDRLSAGIPARLADEDRELGAKLIANGHQPGVNLLLYGADDMDKQGMLHRLVCDAGKSGYKLQEFDRAYKDLPTVAFVAQRALYREYGADAVLVIDRPADVLERKPNEFFRMLFGLDVDSSHIAPFDEMLLATNPAPTVWTGPGADSLPEETMGRFVFHAPLQRATREDRRRQLEALVSGLKLSKKTTEELLRLEDVSALQLTTALRASKLSGATSRKEQEAALIQAVKRSLKAVKRDVAPKTKECVTEYSLKYLNCAGKFGPQQVLKALSNRPRGSLCLYGPPGTGKTQFVEHLAASLGKRLIAKQASQLLSKYIGESEKNIAAMFAEARDAEALMFLDEGDSFLRDRTRAEHAWEITQVNELLQHMERFEGIFIIATNLFRGLDAAALRRFTFKLEFCALTPDQRWEMFVNEAGLKGRLGEYSRSQRDKWFDELVFLPQLAAGDFATVKRQCVLLGETLSPQEWLEQLKLECAVKSTGEMTAAKQAS